MIENLVGKKYGRWLVISRAEDKIIVGNRHIRHWLCKCDCGTERVVKEQSLKDGTSKSCGCYHSDIMHDICRKTTTTHGMSNDRLYRIYEHMKNRCYNTKDVRYKYYGGRGITVCDEWQEFEPFMEWALSNGYRDNLSIDRINVDLGYFPSNCRWATIEEQAQNKRNVRYYEYNGEEHCISEWARIYNMNYKKLWKRLERGWDIEKALTA